ncbi:dihydroorotate dehydrogenase electron transfer subunit [Anaerolentibacter hominis]|uniref:dihydroorotate dehydrogenase electron transfer subunit n=1 Tax=Anaerolentibacter hominis TaxID=3079009 RepID=UPI0031B8596B
MVKKRALITSNICLLDDIYSMWLKDADIAAEAKAGQFLSLYCNDGSRLLPRPISICEINAGEGMLRLVYRIAGKGTEEFSRLSPGTSIEVMGPLGNGFTLEGTHPVVIGGGIGIPPMLELAKQLTAKGLPVQIVLGYRDRTFLTEEFEKAGTVTIATEDGSSGVKGNVIDAVRKKGIVGDIIFACGPTPMLKGIKAYAEEQDIPAQISLEEKMACGIGACLACVCKSKETDSHSHVKNKRICKDGPVFYAKEVELP